MGVVEEEVEEVVGVEVEVVAAAVVVATVAGELLRLVACKNNAASLRC